MRNELLKKNETRKTNGMMREKTHTNRREKGRK